MEFWRGSGRTAQDPFIVTTNKPETLVCSFGQEFTIPIGCETKHFESLNRGWISWVEDGRVRIRDVG